MEKFNYDHLPDKLKKIGLFAPWNTAMRHDRLQKIPFKLNGEWASTTSMDRDFHDFDTAMNAFMSGNYKGIGVGITRGVCAIDIDHCVKDGMISPLAQEILTVMAGCYIEISQSGEGLHLLFLAPPGIACLLEQFFERNEELELEVYISGYSGGRFIALTGQCYGGDLIEVDPSPILDKYMQRPIVEDPIDVTPVADMPDLDDFEIVEHMEKIPKAARLLDGDTSGYASDSEAVEALIWCCLFWTDKSDQVERIIRNSRMQWKRADDHRGGMTLLRYSIERGRKKYNGQRYSGGQRSGKSDDPMMMDYDDVIRVDSPSESDPDVEEITAEDHSATGEAMAASTSETVSAATSEAETTPQTATEDQPVKPPIGLVCASTVEYQEPRWLWKPYLQKGKLNCVQGESGAGKTALICALAAAVTTGTPIMNSPLQDSGSVLMLSVEDDPAILRGRFEADGGDVRKLFFMNDAYKLSFGSLEIEQAIQATGAKLVIFDPMQSFLGNKVDMHRANETRPVMAALAAMAERNDCAILIVAHTGKSTDKSAVYRSLGSADVPAAMRSILHVARDPDDPDECVALHVKSSNEKSGEALSYIIGERGRVDWRGFRGITIRDVEGGKSGRSAPAKQDCKKFILTALQDGEIPSVTLDEQLKMAGFSRSTVNRAKSEMRDDEQIRYIPTITEEGKQWRIALGRGIHVAKRDE